MTMRLTIDGREAAAEAGQTVLEVARGVGVDIPTLCYHEALEARGACRLCMVEISNPTRWPGRTRLVASCVYPAEEGLEVRTTTPEVQEIRRTLVDLLMARCPETAAVTELGDRFGLEATSFEPRADDDRCVLCGLCVRVCEDVIGAYAIGISGRGATKVIGPPLGGSAEACTGCGACAHVCPTGCIEVIDEGATRRIPRWGVELELVACRECGAPVSTRAHIDFVRRRVGVGVEVLETCPACHRRRHAQKVAAEGHM
jgi:NADH dehydrogenase/NADH:ubiquinone oxidoreductase subunit G